MSVETKIDERSAASLSRAIELLGQEASRLKHAGGVYSRVAVQCAADDAIALGRLRAVVCLHPDERILWRNYGADVGEYPALCEECSTRFFSAEDRHAKTYHGVTR